MLNISLLGEIVIRLHGEPLTRFRSQKEAALLAYLAYTGQTHNREALADLLWEASSTKQSLSNLRTVLARLRKQVGEYLIVTRKTVAVTPSVHEQTNTTRFQALLAGVSKGEGSVTAVTHLTQGLKLYSGEFMTGFSIPKAPRFNDWLMVEQERLRQIAMQGYRQLAAWQEEQGAFAAGVVTVQQWTLWDPLDEVAQRQLMRLLAYDGRVSEALAAYEKCRHLLQTELDIPPAPATTTLYKTIRDGSLSLPNISPVPLHNLPRALSPFYGRKKEIKELTSHLLNPHYPLVSVTGLGGIGKTSLALAAGRELLATGQPPFKDGIWFISLEEIENDTPEKVRDKIAALVGQAMGLHFHSESALWSQLLGQLAPKKTLLILDNIEQFFTAASDLIVQLLEAGDNIHLLVTSRTALALAASVTLPLTGLETPAQASVEALQNESVRLFAERAARMPTPFHLEKHLAEVVAICQFVEGMPLGIELAAASLGWLMVDEIMPALTNNLRLLNANRRDLPPRQRTLHAVFDYTWQLLTPLEQTLLVQISIFRGGFTRRAAEAILNDAGSGLFNLQHHALLGRDETGRFKMHPLLRQLACEKLSDSDTAVAELTLHRHSAYFSAFMGAFAKELQCGEGQEALQTIFPEQANLRAAWQYAVQAGKWQTIANCLDGYHFFYKRKGFYTEEMTLIDGAIAALQATMTADNVSLTCLLSRLLAVQAWDYLYSAQLEKGAETAERACKMAQGLENVNLAAQARLVWARLLYRQSKHDSALAQYEQVVSLAKIAQNPILEADGWIGIGGQIAWQADVEPAREPLRYALNLCQSLQYKPGEMQTLTWLGILAMRQEAFAESEQFYKRALWLSRRLGETPAEAELLGNLGVVARYRDDLVGSQSYQEEALTVFRQLNMPGSEQWLLGELGLTATQLGDYAIAEQNLTDALEIARQIKDVFWQAWVKSRLGTIWNERGELDKALSFLTEAFATAEQLQNPRLQGMVLYDWGNVCLNQTDWVQAEQKFQKAYDLWHGLGQTQLAMPSLAGLAFATYRQKKLEIAAGHAESLWQTWQESPKLAERAYLKLYWMLGLVWDGLGDDRANHLWEKAHALLQRRSEKIADEGARRIFLEQAPAHRAILHRV